MLRHCLHQHVEGARDHLLHLVEQHHGVAPAVAQVRHEPRLDFRVVARDWHSSSIAEVFAPENEQPLRGTAAAAASGRPPRQQGLPEHVRRLRLAHSCWTGDGEDQGCFRAPSTSPPHLPVLEGLDNGIKSLLLTLDPLWVILSNGSNCIFHVWALLPQLERVGGAVQRPRGRAHRRRALLSEEPSYGNHCCLPAQLLHLHSCEIG
mmetsp:Transcript_28700/g.49665  ORF Transcript_28700/g.49665 Transcript_28700/m.49665 type:complete len:206 (+) Transcript_28700:2502-3119(+)